MPVKLVPAANRSQAATATRATLKPGMTSKPPLQQRRKSKSRRNGAIHLGR